MKKFLMMLLGIFLIAGGNAKAQDVYVGTSPATGWECYLMTETIQWLNDLTDFKAQLKMVDIDNDIAYFIEYRFWHEVDDINRGIYDQVFFANSDGFNGIVNPGKTPIEYSMWSVGTSYYADGVE